MKISLPIDALLPQVGQILSEKNNLILKASPGAGKTTRVPPYLLSAPWGRGKKIYVLEPRRLAAKFSAHRVAQELGTEVGKTVGYEFRFERKTSSDTQLIFLTEGLLMKKLLSNPNLSDVSAVILDEFHERHLHGDIALAYLKNLQLTTRPDLKIIVMSATIDIGPVSAYLGNAPTLEQELPPHPVEIRHLNLPDTYLEKKCLKAVREALESGFKGDILVFLPGMFEIRKAESTLSDARLPQTLIYVLHGEIAQNEQEEATRPMKGFRKIILSTNIAETSLTIEGVNVVIDSGLEKRAVVDEWTQITELQTRKISQASARQRTGRSSRTAPGLCIRLYSKSEFDSLLPFTPPEIQRSELTKTYLELLTLGVKDLTTFPWFESPRKNLIEGAEILLTELGALASTTQLTSIGRQMAELPTHPRVAGMLIKANGGNCLETTAWIAAGLMDGKLPKGDLISQWQSLKSNSFLKRSFDQVLRSLDKPAQASAASLIQCLLAGFPDRVAKRKEDTSSKFVEYVLATGGVAQLERTEAPDSDFLLVLEAKKHDSGKTFIHSYTALDLEDIFDNFTDKLEDSVVSWWDREKERILSRSRVSYHKLVLMESRSDKPSDEDCIKILLEEALNLAHPESLSLKEILARLHKIMEAEMIESQLARIELFTKEAMTPPLFLEFLKTRLIGKSSLKDLKEVDWKNELLFHFLKSKAHELDQKIPEQLSLPNGKKMKIVFSLGNSPKCSLKIQELFGLKTTPKICNGTLPILLEILGPNYRPVQVTSDLAGFWKRSYPALRKELSRKYPRHKWPEDPTS